MENCLVKKNHKFLWWKWTSFNYEHKWEYTDKEHRRCVKCGKWEFLFEYGYNFNTENRYEDWRRFSPGKNFEGERYEPVIRVKFEKKKEI